MRGIFITLSNISKGNAFPHQGVTNCVKYECSTQDSGTPFPNSVTTPFYFALLAKYRDKGRSVIYHSPCYTYATEIEIHLIRLR